LTGTYLKVLNDEDINPQALVDTLDGITGEIADKVPNIVTLIRTWESEAKACKEEEDRLAARRKALENRSARSKAYMQECMERIGTDKIKTPLVTVAIQNNPKKVEIIDQTVIPASFLVIIPERYDVDKAMVKDALEAGEEIPGARLVQGRSLRIR
jgi:hypothetical protein